MLKLTKISAILFVVGTVVELYTPTSLFSVLEDIGFLGLLIAAAYYGYHLLKKLKRLLLWKVRNKVIVSYAFVGIIPVLILAFIAWFASRLVLGQLSALYLEDELENISETLHHVGERIVIDFYQHQERDQTALNSILQAWQQSLPANTALRILDLEEAAPSEFGAAETETLPTRLLFSLPENRSVGEVPSAAQELPRWTLEGFDGLVKDAESLQFRSVLPVRVGTELHALLLDLPFDESLFAGIEQRTSIQIAPFQIPLGSDLPVGYDSLGRAEGSEMSLWDFFSGQEQFVNILWIHPLNPVDWANGQRLGTTVEGVVLTVPLRTLYAHYFTETAGLGPFVLYLIAILGVVFVVVEAVSFLVGVAIARSITRSIHDIYAGTSNIQQGNFDFRIPNRNRDQLDSMAGAFNSMAESVVRLMVEVSEKEWLEKEIEIAREVQAQLFPQKLPSVLGLQLAGTCLPARRVSGDYYDFIPYSAHRLDTIIADISGKGISAALLMASLQSSVRTHLTYQSSAKPGGPTISAAVSEINEQLYRQTPPDKFATLVLSRIDTRDLTLTYCNAGHNPPFLLSNGEIRRLSQGGMVAGLFENRPYEQETVDLNQDDLVVFYTDGIVESENSESEQFGERRLVELVKMNSFLTAEDIQSLILAEVSTWVGSGVQSDDITLVVVKVEQEIETRGLPFQRG